jgi:hypothetical protein
MGQLARTEPGPQQARPTDEERERDTHHDCPKALNAGRWSSFGACRPGRLTQHRLDTCLMPNIPAHEWRDDGRQS